MPRHLLDSDTCIFWLKEHPGVVRRVAQHGGLKNMWFSSITMGEVYMGAYLFPNSDTGLSVTDRFFRTVRVLPYDHVAGQRFGGLRAKMMKMPAKDTLDLMNACIALTQKMVVVTHNLSDYRQFHGLKVEDWATFF